MATVVLLLALIALSIHGTTGKRGAPDGLVAASPAAPGVFDVTTFGVKHKDKVTEDETNSLNGLALGRAWNAACQSNSPGGVARLVIPKGQYEVGPALFHGPCNSSVTVDIQGTLTPNPNGSIYPESYWLLFEDVAGVTITGTGTIDGQGQPYEYCKTRPDCSGNPNIKIFNSSNVLIEGPLNSINPTFAHIHISYSRNVTVRNMKMTAPENSLRTDGVQIALSEHITITNSTISTGTDCVNIVHGSKDVTITDVNCGPGSGISIGSYYTLMDIGTSISTSLDVEGVLVKRCNFIRTTNGLTIKTLLGAQGNKVSAVTFEDLVMDHDTSPQVPAKINDIHFKNIKGTSTTRDLVNFACSPVVPCEGVEIADVDLVFDEKAILGAALPVVPPATCLNVKPIFNGKHDGINC
ncbi:hypothetical protein Cgig2_026558 [Carnegiea gigantea]|uniref:Uncharacterized protein n=1 Tax=Carnegiea gigantea TaxID=171969 RepID=A0A9Q1Q4Y2_9CARY|nr:hypothetical protein Cgig2_026558 [Carnegiea gigantea]